MGLSERQLLLLDEFMYSDLAPNNQNATLKQITEQYMKSNGDVNVEKIQRDIDNNTLHLSGDMNKNAKDFSEVVKQIHNDSTLSSLKLTHTTAEREGSIRGACFVDAKTGEATVAFRGTGGSYRQWSNNFEGYGDISQQSQRDAAEFINSLPYNNLTVTGHSNGGNQAMYVSVVCGDKVSRCVSYEGQGFSDEFCLRYMNEIAQNKGKITNISGNTDFVNTLLNNIAGKTYYVKTEGETYGPFTHGGFGLLKVEENFLSNGSFNVDAQVDRSLPAQGLYYAIQVLTHCSNVPHTGRDLERFMDLAGSIVGLIMSEKSKTTPGVDSQTLKNLLSTLFDQTISNGEYIIGGAYLNLTKEAAKNLWDKWTNAIEAVEKKANSIIDSLNPFKKKNETRGSGGGGGGSFSGGGSSRGFGHSSADVIKVSTAQMAAALNRYQAEKARLMDAVNICNQAAQTLAQSWAGPSFLSMSVKLADTYKNLFQSVEKIEDAISELKQVIQIYERTETANTAVAAGLDVGESPFS